MLFEIILIEILCLGIILSLINKNLKGREKMTTIIKDTDDYLIPKEEDDKFWQWLHARLSAAVKGNVDVREYRNRAAKKDLSPKEIDIAINRCRAKGY